MSQYKNVPSVTSLRAKQYFNPENYAHFRPENMEILTGIQNSRPQVMWRRLHSSKPEREREEATADMRVSLDKRL